MFQIAAAIGYARKYGYQWSADYGRGVGEPYSCIHESFPNLPKHELSGVRYHEHPNEFCQVHGVHKNECHFDYHPIPNLGGNVSLIGFFQSYKYFEGQDEEIKKVFALPHIEGYEDYVSIHVRRGDYVQHSGSFPPIDAEYLKKAILQLRINIGAEKFIVFSDDIEWCKQTLINHESEVFLFSEGRTEIQDLALMASCGHHIIANSTFSWWGAYLGHNPNKIVITPSAQTWFGPTAGVKKPVVDLLPSNWIQIHTR
jgi:hypothetical protein